MKWLLCLALLTVASVASVANGQTVTVSGFVGQGPGWATNMEEFNGTWSLSPVGGGASAQQRPGARPIREENIGGGAPGSYPPGAMVMVKPASSGLEVLFLYRTATGYTSILSKGLFGTSGTIVLDPAPGQPARTISVN